MGNNTKGYSLDKGFLFDKSWAKAMRKLSPEDFHKVFWELYDYQDSKGNSPIPSHEDNPILDTYTDLIVPHIVNRLNGQRGGHKASAQESNNTMGSIGGSIEGSIGGGTLKLSKDKLSKDKLSKDKIAIASKDATMYREEFETLWEKYPRKSGKKNAFLSYIKARTRVSNPVDYETVERGINNYNAEIQALKREAKYIKNGSSWFAGEGWNDEYQTQSSTIPTINKASELDGIL